MAQLDHNEEKGLLAFKERVMKKFGDRAVAFRLFGSKARGDTWEESDTDILVLVKKITWREKNDIIDISTEINSQYDLMLSPLVMMPEEFDVLLKRERRIACDIEREGMPL